MVAAAVLLLVSLFLVNEQSVMTGRSVPQWLCQAELSVRARDGSAIARISQIKTSTEGWRASAELPLPLAGEGWGGGMLRFHKV